VFFTAATLGDFGLSQSADNSQLKNCTVCGAKIHFLGLSVNPASLKAPSARFKRSFI